MRPGGDVTTSPPGGPLVMRGTGHSGRQMKMTRKCSWFEIDAPLFPAPIGLDDERVP
jgi:hypothetical protein